MDQTRSAELLREFQATIKGGTSGKRKASISESVGAMWEYLVKTPGEQKPYADFGAMFGGVNPSSAFSRIKTLVGRGVITKTSGRKGAGGGAGFCCPWLEERRTGTASVAVSAPIMASGGVKVELVSIDAIAERGVQSMRSLMEQDSPVGLAMVEMLREIQTRATRAMSGLVNK